MANQVISMVFQTRQTFPTADSTVPRKWWPFAKNVLNGCFTGNSKGNLGSPTYAEQLLVSDNNTYGSSTVTFTSVAAGNTLTVNGVVFRAVSGTPNTANNEFDMSSTDTADAASFVTTFNACTDSRVYGLLTASSALGVVTFTPKFAGTGSNTHTIETTGIVATGTITYVTPSGTETATINGVAVTATAGATATLTATAMAAAINASTDPLVLNHVRATSALGVVTIYAQYPGTRGNAITLAASGTGATAGAARLASGTTAQTSGAQATGTITLSSGSGTITAIINGVSVAITWATSDTNSGDLLAAAINSSTNSLVRDSVYAANAAGVVTVTARAGGISGNAITLAATGTGSTASAARLTTGAGPTQIALTTGTVGQSFNGGRLSGATQSAPVTYSF